jgi:hypothetical protein
MSWPITRLAFGSVVGVGDIVAVEWFGSTPRRRMIFVTREVFSDWPSFASACVEQLGDEQEVVSFFGERQDDRALWELWYRTTEQEMFQADHRN